jgi:membrane associated rhomboid family serine protease
MMPLRDDDSGVHLFPVVNYVLIAINVLAFLYELSLGGGTESQALVDFITRYGAVPADISQGRNLISLLTSMFLHGGWSHLFGNMLFLWIFGNNIEDRLGHLGYVIFYMVCGLAASLAQVFMQPGSELPGIGASGAIAGVLGAYLALFASNRVQVLLGYFLTTVPAWMTLGIWIVTQFVSLGQITDEMQSQGGVAYMAHIGGFVAGFVIAFALRRKLLAVQRVPSQRLIRR